MFLKSKKDLGLSLLLFLSISAAAFMRAQQPKVEHSAATDSEVANCKQKFITSLNRGAGAVLVKAMESKWGPDWPDKFPMLDPHQIQQIKATYASDQPTEPIDCVNTLPNTSVAWGCDEFQRPFIIVCYTIVETTSTNETPSTITRKANTLEVFFKRDPGEDNNIWVIHGVSIEDKTNEKRYMPPGMVVSEKNFDELAHLINDGFIDVYPNIKVFLPLQYKEETTKKEAITKKEETATREEITKKKKLAKREKIAKREEITKKKKLAKRERIAKREEIAKKKKLAKERYKLETAKTFIPTL
jgi:hypothetical protein